MEPDPIEITSFAVGGRGVGRVTDGRVVFVEGGMPGDRLIFEVVRERRRFIEARVERVLEPSAQRVDPWCEHRVGGCGGCDWQHVDERARAGFQLALVQDVIDRQVRSEVSALHGGSVTSLGYRTSTRMIVSNGRPGFRRSRSDEAIVVDSCGVLAPGLRWARNVDWGDSTELSLRCSEATGEALAVVSPSVGSIDAPEHVVLVGADDLQRGISTSIDETAAGRRFRLSAGSFFQSGPQAVELLTETIAGRVGSVLETASTAIDLYAGVGVFASVLGHRFPSVQWVVVESNRAAVADTRVNLADIRANTVASRVERFVPGRASVVIADPPRGGLGKRAVAVVAASGAPTVVLISCDLGSFGRDARLLVDMGWSLTGVDVLDLFPQTSHIEIVSVYEREKSAREG